jgi:hypothetical protein
VLIWMTATLTDTATFLAEAAMSNAAVAVEAEEKAAAFSISDYLVANWFNMASGVCAVIALFFSAWSFKRTVDNAQVAGQRADIASQYSQFTDFNRLRLEFPKQSHLMEVPRHYREVCEDIRTICEREPSSARAELRIQERGVALLIFSMYEKLLFDLQTLKDEKAGDTSFIEAVLGYLRAQWLRNPRLLYYWAEDGASLCSLFEPTTCDDHRSMVANDVGADAMDRFGPFRSRTR